MTRSTSKIQKGIGLIEVLVTTVVVAVGLLSVASLQSGLMSSSGESKTRSEAQMLAEQKIEELRNNITKNGYEDLDANGVVDAANVTASDSHTGTNASFTRTWTITNEASFLATAPNRKNISVQVSWDSDGGIDSDGDGDTIDPDEKVNVVTEMAWVDPAKSLLYAVENDISGTGTAAVPSPRQNASEDVASENVNASTPTPLPGTVTVTLNNGALPSSINVTGSNGGSFVLTPITTASPTTHFYSTTFGDGIVAVYLCNDAGACTYIQNHFGGVALRIAGTVYSTSGNGLNNIKVAWTSSEVHACYNGTPVHNSVTGMIYDSKPYECVIAGNCNKTDDGVNFCYADTLVSDAQINSRKVGPGGEYGDIGLLGVDDQGGNREQVCFLEDTVNPATSILLNVSGSDVLNTAYLSPVTKRFYTTRRISWNGTANDQKSEGINRSYANHNFLIVARGTGHSANQTCNLKATTNSISLAPREIIRTLNESSSEPNIVLTGTSYSGSAGTAKTLTGSVTASATHLRLYIPETGVCFLNNNSSDAVATAYACAVPSGTASIDIKGGSDEHPALDSAFASCAKTDITTCNWLGNFAATATPSNDCTAPWGTAVTNGNSVTAYQNATEPFGGTCTSEIRTCSGTPGVLSGTYTNQSCTVQPSDNCTTPWGATVVNGSSVTAFNTATVPFGATCVSEVRACTSGILSGSFAFASCTAQTTRNISVSVTAPGTGTVSNITVSGTGAACAGTVCEVPVSWTGTLSATATCSGTPTTVNGTVDVTSATATSAGITLASCTGPVCTTPWNTSLASGGSVTAYLTSSVLSPSTCISEPRYCNNGTLSGTYTNQSCIVIPTYSITVTADNGSGTVTSSTCNGGSCSGLVAGIYTVAATLSGGNTCSKSYTITAANRTVTVKKGTGSSTTCTMAP